MSLAACDLCIVIPKRAVAQIFEMVEHLYGRSRSKITIVMKSSERAPAGSEVVVHKFPTGIELGRKFPTTNFRPRRDTPKG